MSDPTSTKTPSSISVLLARSFCYRLLGDLLSHPVYGDAYERVHEMGGDWQRVAPVLPFKKQDKWIKLFRELYRPLLFKTFEVAAPYRYRDPFQGTEEEYAGHAANRIETELR